MDADLLAAQISLYMSENAPNATSVAPLASMMLFRSFASTEFAPIVYEPVICVVVQGHKETVIGRQAFDLGPGDSLLVSHDIPVSARITNADPSKPYIAVVLALDLALLRGLYEEVGEAVVKNAHASSATKSVADPRLIDSLSRYLALAGDAVETRVMAPLLLREIHFRLLMAPHGAMLRELLRSDSHASHIEQAIRIIRRDFRNTLSVPEIAREVGMSASSFHKHFRDITSSTPLQYQKELRLMEARRQLSVSAEAVSTVAYDVGYASPNQFSREYFRKFGVPPSMDRRAQDAESLSG